MWVHHSHQNSSSTIPGWHGDPQRLPAKLYLQLSMLGIVAAASTLLVVLVVILPIIKHRLQSVTAALNSIAIGVVLSLCLATPEWLRGHGIIQSPIYYHSPKAYEMALGVHVGLAGFNITLRTIDRSFDVQLDGSLVPIAITNRSIEKGSENWAPKIYYNENVKMYHPDNLVGVVQEALERGLPLPILVAIECLTSAAQGFPWSHYVEEAGYHCYIITVFALVGWFLNQVLMAAIPRYSAYGFVIIGHLMIFDATIYFYWADVANVPHCIVITDAYVKLRHGVCFWTCLAVGVWSCIYGLVMTVYDTIYPDKFLTIFDLDYDIKKTLGAVHRANRLSRMNMSYWRKRVGFKNDPFVKNG